MLTTLPNLYRRVLWLRFGHALPRETVAFSARFRHTRRRVGHALPRKTVAALSDVRVARTIMRAARTAPQFAAGLQTANGVIGVVFTT